MVFRLFQICMCLKTSPSTYNFVNPLISIAPIFDWFGWNFQRLLAMVNLEFLFIFLNKILLLSYLSFKIFQCFCRIYLYNFFIFQRIFLFFYCHLAAVLLKSNSLEFLKYLYPFLSYAKNIFIFFSKIILNLSKNI